MRILFINTEDASGGAAVVIKRLMKGLQNQYASENRLFVKTKNGHSDDTEQVLSGKFQINTEKILDRVTRPAGLLYQHFPFSSRSILDKARQFKPDIIHLHNTHGGYFETPLIQRLSRSAPIVWTLHDMWAFTGNASHTFGNMSWKYLRNDKHLTSIPPSIGINTGAWLLRQKKKIYQNSRLTVVTPSLWLKDLARQSPVFENNAIYQIYNGVDTSVFKPQNKQAAKQKLGLPQELKTILFSSHFVDKRNPWKGGDDLVEILRILDSITKEKINFLALGEGRLDELSSASNLNIVYKGYLPDENDMVDCLSAADLFIYPTRADNLPNVLIEAIACGTPAITFDIGGNKEIISNDQNGIIIEPFDLATFARNIVYLLGNREKLDEFSRNCLIKTYKSFQQKTMVDDYYKLFEKIISGHK